MKATRLTPRAIPAVLVGVLAVGGFLFLPGYLLYAGSTALVAGLVGLALVIPLAALRELPLHTAGMLGLSAYVFTYFGSGGDAGGHLTGIGLACLAVLGVALLGGLASLAVTGLAFVVVTLVIQVAIERVVFTLPGLTLGRGGRGVWQPLDHGWLDNQRAIYLVTALVVLACGAVAGAVFRSRTGYRVVLVGHVPEGASAMGLRNWLIKLVAMVASGLLIGIAGVLVAFVNGTPPTPFSFIWVSSVVYLAIPIAAGMRELSAIWLVAATFIVVPITLERFRIHPFFMSAAIVLSALLLSQNRERLAAFLRRAVGLRPPDDGPPIGPIRSYSLAPAPATAAGSDEHDGERPVLEGRDITVDFGGLRAADRTHPQLLARAGSRDGRGRRRARRRAAGAGGARHHRRLRRSAGRRQRHRPDSSRRTRRGRGRQWGRQDHADQRADGFRGGPVGFGGPGRRGHHRLVANGPEPGRDQPVVPVPPAGRRPDRRAERRHGARLRPPVTGAGRLAVRDLRARQEADGPGGDAVVRPAAQAGAHPGPGDPAARPRPRRTDRRSHGRPSRQAGRTAAGTAVA